MFKDACGLFLFFCMCLICPGKAVEVQTTETVAMHYFVRNQLEDFPPNTRNCILKYARNAPSDGVRVISVGGFAYQFHYVDIKSTSPLMKNHPEKNVHHVFKSLKRSAVIMEPVCTDPIFYITCCNIDGKVVCYMLLPAGQCSKLVSGKASPAFESLQDIIRRSLSQDGCSKLCDELK